MWWWPAAHMSDVSLGVSLGILFFLIFLSLGVMMPCTHVWCQSRSISGVNLFQTKHREGSSCHRVLGTCCSPGLAGQNGDKMTNIKHNQRHRDWPQPVPMSGLIYPMTFSQVTWSLATNQRPVPNPRLIQHFINETIGAWFTRLHSARGVKMYHSHYC